ncbi:hypothetical protein, conserved [Leishmania donovani]|uniref:Uncharacterized protein n=1 Tax=Leishmania donovani TaxID=5661 RepID=E9BSH2_LEIDO|nr:hypothetical protein, conserved [Leishmania donovani]TPP44564.1 hypothetical protein CGC21_6985 [Leishmania donovani]CBZ38201.1 hypothetical protein, conserved [Leishmania donovani]
MFKASGTLAALLPSLRFGVNKTDFFTSLWSKPQTRDERVKEYVPEVLEESFEQQRAVLEESTSRDIIVELGNKILQEIDSKSPTPSIAPHLNKLLLEYGVKDVIAQRPLSYLLYPNSSALSAGEQAHELVSSFPDNFRAMIEEVERNGCSAKTAVHASAAPEVHVPKAASSVAAVGHEATSSVQVADGTSASGEEVAPTEPGGRTPGDSEASSPSQQRADGVIMASKDEYEPMDITMFVKVAAGMAMANLHCGDMRNAVRCVDAGISHAKEASRLGGLLALKAGLLVRQKKFAEAAECAKLAVEASGNVQGYLHGAYALHKLNRPEEAVALLERGREDHPMNTQFEAQIEAIQRELKLALPASSSSSSASKDAAQEALPAK